MPAREVAPPEAGPVLPIFERLAPRPATAMLADAIERFTGPGDIVVDLHGRGGWAARAAIDRQRRGLTIETSPLTRLLAEVVLRPPDVRHLDAAFAAIGTAPRGDSSVRAWISARWATRCPTCERTVVLDELIWERPPSEPDGLSAPVRRRFRCSACRNAGDDVQDAPPDRDDLARARSIDDEADGDAARARLRSRFPVLDSGSPLADQLLDLHSPRQLAGLEAILARIESDLGAAPVASALRIAFLHAVLPASRLYADPGLRESLRIASGALEAPAGDTWRERNPWLAFEDGYRLVRDFVAALENARPEPVAARHAPDVAALIDGGGTAAVRLGTPSTYRALAVEAEALRERPGRDRVRLALAVAPPRPTPERLALAYHATAWALGPEAAQLLPLEPLFGAADDDASSWQGRALRRSLAAAEPLLGADARAAVFVDATPEGVVGAAIAAADCRYRLADIRPVADAVGLDGDAATLVELLRPGASRRPGPRTRANVALAPTPGGPGDPDLVPSPGLFSAPEPIESRPFSHADAERAITDAAVATLQARGEAAPVDILLAEVLLALDRTGLLRRYVIAQGRDAERTTVEEGSEDASEERRGTPDRGDDAPPTGTDGDAVHRLLDLIQGELRRPTQRRLAEIAPGRWWLTDRAELDAASPPLADRLEWATYSLLSTAGPLSATAFRDRISNLFRGPDLPDPAMVAACLDSYRTAASTDERLETADVLAARTHEHAELIGLLAETGHRLGLQVWISVRAQRRRYGDRLLGELLERAERTAYLGGIAPGRTEALEEVDVAWYARGGVTFLFEVEWTAMLAEPLLGRHAQLPADDRVVRFLVVPPERAALLAAKLDASPVLRSIVETQNWHVIKWNHVRALAAIERPSLDDLEPLIGIDPAVERASEQLPLFENDGAASGSPERRRSDGSTEPTREPARAERQQVRVARPGDASAGR